jgi:hypothetical protein
MARKDSTDLTAELAEKDAARDLAFVGFRDYCKAFTSTPDAAKSAAAKKLEALIRKLGWSLHSEGYTEQTAAQKTLIESLETAEYAKAVSAIGAEPWVANLKASNAAFEAAKELKMKPSARRTPH